MKKALSILFLFSIICAEITAQSNSDSLKNLSTVLVKGRKKNAKERAEFKRHGQTTEAMTEEDLNRNNPAFIEQSLGTMAGVQVDKRTQLGGQRIVIRGYGNDQKFNNWGVKAYLNNIPLTNAEGVTVLDDIDFSMVNNLEIIKGPASTMYGSGVGGVARFYLKNAETNGTSLSQNTVGGSFGLFQSTTKLEHTTDKSSITLNYGHLQSNGYRPRGASLKNFLTFNSDFKVSEKHTVSVLMSHNFSHEGVAGQIPYANYYAGIDSGNAAYAKKNARTDFQTTRFGISDNVKFNKWLSNMTTVFYSNTESKRVAAGADENSSSPNYGVRSVFAIKSDTANNMNIVLNIGTEIQQCKSLISNYRFTGTNDNIPFQVSPITSGSYFKYTTNQQSIFLHNRFNFKKEEIAIIIGLSANMINYTREDLLASPGLLTGYNKDLSFYKSFKTSLNPHVAIQKTYKSQIFNLSYSEGYNAPTASTAFITAISKPNDSLTPEKARMVEFSAQGLLFDSKFDYQISVFNIDIKNKLTTLSAVNPSGGTYTYTANTGNQQNMGLEASLGYTYEPKNQKVFAKITPFVNYSFYAFKYKDFKTILGGVLTDFTDKTVVGVPKHKATMGLDIMTSKGVYLNTTYNYMGEVYSDFANTNLVRSYRLLNSKLGYKHQLGKRFDLDIYIAGNNLTSEVNYTFLFLGGNINDSDPGSGFAKGVATDVNPGPSKAYFWGGLNLKYRF